MTRMSNLAQVDLLLGLIGDNIAASRSPLLHTLVGRQNGMAVRYDRLVPPQMGMDFEAVFEQARAQGYRGVNVTYPYKERVCAQVQVDDPLVRAVGAVNTVIFEAEGARGHNTDFSGFMAAYRRVRGEAAPGTVVMIGTGGVGRAVAFGLAALPLAGCAPIGPDRDVLFIPADKAAALTPDDPKRLLELIKLDPAIRLDMRYATANNFTGRVLYDEARAFLAAPAAQAVARASKAALADGFGLTIYDAYRPWRITKKLWDATPVGPKKEYVANPKRGSKHNRGCAVDLTLHDLQTWQLVEMPTEFDDFSEKAHRDYAGASAAAMANRARLARYLEAEGFIGLSNEWWHFDFTGWEQFPVMDIPFNKIV